jgi:hypothetical protein
MPLNAITHLIHQFELVILLVKVNKSYFVLKEKNVTSHGGGLKSVYLNGPLLLRDFLFVFVPK